MSRSSFTINILSLLLLTLFASSAFAAENTTTAEPTAPYPTVNGTYTKPEPTSTGKPATTSTITGAAAMPDAQFSAFFALAVAIFGSFALGLGL